MNTNKLFDHDPSTLRYNSKWNKHNSGGGNKNQLKKMALGVELPVDLFESDAKAESSKEAIRFYIQHLSRNDLKAVEVLCLQLARASGSYQDWRDRVQINLDHDRDKK